MTLQIEEGKFYRSAAGVKVGPMRPLETGRFSGGGHTLHDRDGLPFGNYPQVYTTDGGVYDIRKGEEDHRLVAEWVVEPLQKLVDTPDEAAALEDLVNHPPHYTGHASGIECIQITEHMNFCRGNAVKYIWRAGEKGNEIEDLQKARWYIDREISRLQKINA